MILLINWYIDPNPARQEELQQCLERNLDNRHIDRIVAFMEPGIDIIDSVKIIRVPFIGRPTYTDFFREGNKHAGVKILANSDIYFDDSIVHGRGVYKDQVFALCRWDIDADGKATFLNNKNSQDVWIWRSKVEVDTQMTLGQWGCDNHIAGVLHGQGYGVISPSLTIRANHLHNTGVYHYRPKPIPLPIAFLKYDTMEDIDQHEITSSIIYYAP